MKKAIVILLAMLACGCSPIYIIIENPEKEHRKEMEKLTHYRQKPFNRYDVKPVI